jgi:hypothetical protein
MKLWGRLRLSWKLARVRPVEGLVLVSASDSSHAKSLGNWLESAALHEPGTPVVVYDLGMTCEERVALARRHPGVQIRRFAYERHPDYFDIRVAAGQYAWKPVIIHEVARDFARPVCWMDGGNIIDRPLSLVRKILGAYGFYSPASKGRVIDWTHPATLSALDFPADRLRRRNLNGACVAFDPANAAARELLEAWHAGALQKAVIAPPGSDRTNHRQDQAVLSALLHRSDLGLRWPYRAAGFPYFGFRTHQDADQP